MAHKFNYGNSDKIPWVLPFTFLEEMIKSLGKVFSTTDLTDLWIRVDFNAAKEYEELRGRNWRAFVGKRLKEYSTEFQKIEQVSPEKVSPARWRKLQ